ncbi:MAG: hypothetical protein WCO72_13555 [Betaproteobacteria bacterium]
MATRRRGVKHSHNKTRTIIKALLRKTTYKNKKNKQNKTKKRYQSGGGPTTSKASKAQKARAKGASGIKAEPKVARSYERKGEGYPDMSARQAVFQKQHPTAEFDIPIEVSGLEYNISVKSVKRKTPGQNSFTIMCGDARRFIGQVALGEDPYHMVIAIRQKHSTKPGKQELDAAKIDLRAARSFLFGGISDCDIKKIVEASNELTEAYCKNSDETKPRIDEFNAYLTRIDSPIQLAPKKENRNKGRAPRLQTSISYTKKKFQKYSKNIDLSSQENTPPEDSRQVEAGPAMERQLTSSSRATSRSRGTSYRSKGASYRSGVSKQPTPPVTYFRSFTPRVRVTPQPLSTILEEQQIVSQAPRQLSALPEEEDE